VRLLAEPGAGPARARNVALACARGELVAFLDSDNWWLPDHLAVAAEVLAINPEAVLVSTCRGFTLAGRARPARATVVDALPDVLVLNDVGFVSCVAVRRAALVAVGGFDEELWVAEDADLWARLAAEGRFAYVRRRTVFIQRTPDSVSEIARADGRYFVDAELAARHRLAHVEQAGPERALPAAAAMHRFAAAELALERGDSARATEELTAARRHLPQLDADAGRLAALVRSQLPRGAPASDRLAALADAWPDPRAPTVHGLRALAGLYELRRGRLRAAGAMLRQVPLRALPRLGLGALSVFGVSAGRIAALDRPRGEAPDLDAVGHVRDDDRPGSDEGRSADANVVTNDRPDRDECA
jgi:glycosyl transferase family 2